MAILHDIASIQQALTVSAREWIKRIIPFCRKSSFNEIVINIYVNCHQNLKRHVNIRIWAAWNQINLQFQRKAALNAKALISVLALIVSFESFPSHIHPHLPSRCSWSKHQVVWINEGVQVVRANWFLFAKKFSGKICWWQNSKILPLHNSQFPSYTFPMILSF